MKWVLFLWPASIAIFSWLIYVDAKRIESPETQAEIHQNRLEQLSNRVTYLRDTSTGLCFAIRQGSNDETLDFTSVQCDNLTNVPVSEFATPTK